MVRVLVRVRVSVFICPSEPSRERVKVSHVIVECRVINHHPSGTELVFQEGQNAERSRALYSMIFESF